MTSDHQAEEEQSWRWTETADDVLSLHDETASTAPASWRHFRSRDDDDVTTPRRMLGKPRRNLTRDVRKLIGSRCLRRPPWRWI